MKIVADKIVAPGWRVTKIHPPKWCMTVVVKSTFQLQPDDAVSPADDGPGTVLGDEFLDNDPNKSIRYSTDLVPYKARSDVLLAGTAHAPRGESVGSIPVGMRVGELTKRLVVFGDRTWETGGPSEPQPFVSMPVVYENAFGGEGVGWNPVGKGRAQSDPPNIEYPERLVQRPSDRIEPAGFGPLAADWEPRRRMVGTYGKDWQKERWPWLPSDFDWNYFNAAPSDQQCDGYLHGDEDLEFENLHPVHSIYRSRLPGLRARAFLSERVEDEPQFREVPLKLDTLWIDMDEEKLVLIWRGLADVRSMRLTEIEHLFLIAEPLGAPAKELDDYREELLNRLREEQSEPPEIQAALRDAEKAEQQAEQKIAEAEAKRKEAEEQFAARFGRQGDTERKDSGPMFVQLAAAMREQLAKLNERGASVDHPLVAQLESQLVELEKLMESTADPAPMSRAAVEAALANGENFRERNLAGADLSGLDFSDVDMTEAILADAKLVGCKLVQTNLAGVVFANTDLTGADLTRAFLQGAVFNDVIVKDANFVQSYIEEALFNKLDFPGGDFSGARGRSPLFQESNLAGARFVGAKLPAATFMQSNLEGADFTNASLRGAMLLITNARGVRMEKADISGLQANVRADLTDSVFSRARGENASFQGARLDHANFFGTKLQRSVFDEASLRGAFFDRADLTGASFADAQLEQSFLTNAKLLRTVFDRANMTGAKVRGSNAFEANFWDTVVEETDFHGVNLKRTLLG